MGVIYTAFGSDKKPHIYAVPEGVSPETVAEQYGLQDTIWGYCESEAEAKRRIESEPTGKLESW